jgi:penicillin-binding protein 2
VIRELSRKEGEAGADLRTSPGSRPAAARQRRLEGESGAIVVMEIHGGDVRALVSSPSYRSRARFPAA